RPTTATGGGPRSCSASVCAAATATDMASSGVRSAFARPRTPSVPKSPPTHNLREEESGHASLGGGSVPGRGSGGQEGQRFEYWGALRAFFRPYFLLSVTRASRVRNPAFFRAGRRSGSNSHSARAIA